MTEPLKGALWTFLTAFGITILASIFGSARAARKRKEREALLHDGDHDALWNHGA